MSLERKSLPERDPIDMVYFFRVNGSGEEVGEPIRIGLLPDGKADLSLIPSGLRETWEADGVMDRMGLVTKPEDGIAFLQALLDRSNPYERFRSTPEKR